MLTFKTRMITRGVKLVQKAAFISDPNPRKSEESDAVREGGGRTSEILGHLNPD